MMSLTIEAKKNPKHICSRMEGHNPFATKILKEDLRANLDILISSLNQVLVKMYGNFYEEKFPLQ